MRKKKRREFPKIWTWISFIIFSLLISWFGYSLIKKKNPNDVLKSIFVKNHVDSDIETYSKAELIEKVERSSKLIDSLQRKLDLLEERFGFITAVVKVESETLNMRSEPSLSGNLIMKIPNESVVSIIEYGEKEQYLDGALGSWYKINFGGSIGWVWGNYLEVLD